MVMTETAAMAQWMVGETYFHQKEYRAALGAFLKVDLLYDHATWRALALLQAGKCHELLHELTEAKQLYDQILAQNLEPDHQRQALERLRALNATVPASRSSTPDTSTP